MSEKTNSEQLAEAEAAKKVADAKVAEEQKKAEADSQDPLKKELNKVQKEGKTELEKAIYKRNQIDEQIKKLGGEKVIVENQDEDDNKPLTRGEWKKMQQDTAQKSALDMANTIEDETERELVAHHIKNTIKPSGNPSEDLKNARAIVNSVKNSQIAEEITRKREAKRNSTGGGGAPGKHDDPFEPTAEELKFMQPPWNMSKDEIMKARRNSA